MSPSALEMDESPDEKILKDLDVLIDRINLGNEMLKQSNFKVSHDSGEAMLQVFGFIKACQPRMVELIEAAAQGALQEGTLMRCLEVNDLVTKALDFENAEKFFYENMKGSASATPKQDNDVFETPNNATASIPSDPFAGQDLFATQVGISHLKSDLPSTSDDFEVFGDSKKSASKAIDDVFDIFADDRKKSAKSDREALDDFLS
eukprot:CAMPEP_0116058702 /NCGR_PEP_ID=MMETSP0322-20121206/5357_1 /TAXON_ID=163516 /ORGANISM="Leptocylindrus danicus var. apora, Strain B651" /LENGTH=204 /DNA_ID=CAMNT_0003542941 /DNA_START=267 /DNA_END=881 /DNA_ORIENTATION=+